jgi:hypothetical protein
LTIAVDVEPSYHALAWKAFQMLQEGHSQREGKVVEAVGNGAVNLHIMRNDITLTLSKG